MSGRRDIFMGDRKNDNNAVFEIDLKRIADRLLHRLWVVVTVSIIGAILSFVFTHYFITPMYQSSAMF